MKNMIQENDIPREVADDKSTDTSHTTIENKTRGFENQLGLLNAKFEMFIACMTSFNQNKTKEFCYACHLCPYETTKKNELVLHKQNEHKRTLSCHKCDFKSTEIGEMRTHKKEEHPQIIHL